MATTAPDPFLLAADLLFPEPDPYTQNPVEWMHAILGEHTWTRQRDIAESVRDHRHTAVRSAHGTGKSWLAARIVAWWISTHDDAFAVTSAPTAPQIEAILWRELGRAHRKGSLDGYLTAGAVPMWKTAGGEIIAFGRKPQDLSNSEEAAAAFQGIHAKHVLVVLDEAGGIPKWLWDAAESLATNEHSRVLAIGNPTDPNSHFAKVSQPGSGWHKIRVSARDLPAFTGEHVHPDLADRLTGRTWVDDAAKFWGRRSALYVSKVDAEFPEVAENALITPAMIRAAQERELPGLEAGRYGMDIAEHGTDETCIYRNRGGVIRIAERADPGHAGEPAAWRGEEVDTSTERLRWILDGHGGGVGAVIDAIGLGSGTYSFLRRREYPVVPFIASESPRLPQTPERPKFKNRRAEMWWEMREALRRGEIDLPPDGEDDELASQLLQPRYEVVNGYLVVESVESMKKRGLPSPDRATAAMQSLVQDGDGGVVVQDDERRLYTGERLAPESELLNRDT